MELLEWQLQNYYILFGKILRMKKSSGSITKSDGSSTEAKQAV
jgi:hypothetical protein